MDGLAFESMRAYQVLCGFGGMLLYRQPRLETLEELAAQRSLLLTEPFSSMAPSAAAALYKVLDAPADKLFESIRHEHSFLFSMVGLSHASPYESVYRTDDQTMFGPSTLEVRAIYRAWGLEFFLSSNEPDDHIGLELMFVSFLLKWMAAARGAEKLREETAALCDFLAEHLLVFAPVYFERVLTAQPEGFYPNCVRIVQATLRSLAAALGVRASAAPVAHLLLEQPVSRAM